MAQLLSLARRAWLRHATALACLSATAGAQTVLAQAKGVAESNTALPTELASETAWASPLGPARMRFFGLDIYDARLWVVPGFKASDYAQSPLALELTYFRSLSGRAIAERSLKEMQRQGPLTAEQEKTWLAAMLQAFPDVKSGDRIVGAHTPGNGARFWHNGQARAAMRDADFSRSFFGIWLSEATSEPQMRARLLGLAP